MIEITREKYRQKKLFANLCMFVYNKYKKIVPMQSEF